VLVFEILKLPLCKKDVPLLYSLLDNLVLLIPVSRAASEQLLKTPRCIMLIGSSISTCRGTLVVKGIRPLLTTTVDLDPTSLENNCCGARVLLTMQVFRLLGLAEVDLVVDREADLVRDFLDALAMALALVSVSAAAAAEEEVRRVLALLLVAWAVDLLSQLLLIG